MAETKPRKHPAKAEGVDLPALLLRAAESGLLLVDAQGTISVCNSAAGRMLQVKSDEGTSPDPRSLPAPLVALAAECVARAEPILDRLIVLDRGRGDELVARCSAIAAPATGAGGVLLAVQDLTSARELETKTERLQKLATVGTLSAGVAHEIKNALVAIKSFAELLLERQPDSEAATLVRREVGRIDTLVSQLLRFAGPARPTFGTVRVHDLLQNGLRLVRHPLKTRQIEELLMLEATNDRVNGDAKQLEQAFLNLLLNAVEAMGDRGRLVIRTEVVVATEHISKFEPQKREPQIQVEIGDTGPGIPPELMPRLFTPFTTTKPDGTGLGLAITRRIVQEHHGTIAVESRPGKGATFRILLPLTKPVA